MGLLFICSWPKTILVTIFIKQFGEYVHFHWSTSVFSLRYEARKWHYQYGWLYFQVVRSYTFMKEINVYIRALHIVFLFVKTENYDFIREIKHVIRSFIAWWKPRQSLWEFSSRWKPSTASWAFTDLLSNSPKRAPRFSPGYEGTENFFFS